MMADYLQVYFAAKDDRAELVNKVSSALGVPLEPTAEPYADYMGRTEMLVFDFATEHSLEDDAGIPFEDMPYVLTVRGARGQEQEQAARAIFTRIKELDYHPVYLVKGLGKILESKD